MSKNDPSNEPEPQPPDLFSSVEARAMLEEFRELVRAGILRVTPENEVLPAQPPPGGGERQTQAPGEDVALLDKQLLEWIERQRAKKAAEAERKTEAKPEEPEAIPASIRQIVIERLAQKILESWDDVDQSVRDQVVERVAEDILRRLHRKSE